MDIFNWRTIQHFSFRVICVTIWILFGAGHALDLDQCGNPLGMQSGLLKDEQLTASSSYNKAEVGPENARIRTEQKGGAWCPKETITKDTYEYIQIDLVNLTVITKVETQGRFGYGQGQEYATAYLLEYQREDGGNWIRFRNRKGIEIFKGNLDTYRAELREVSPPIIAKRIRFIPYSQHPRTVCMRVEMYGCPWEDGLVSYDMPQGSKRGNEVDLYDFTYDGMINEQLSSGLGQLTDGEMGDTNFRLDSLGLGMKGYEWVGWKNESGKTKPIEIIFKFDTVRNFSGLSLHCNNHYSKDVWVFRKAEIFFSIGGKYYNTTPIVFEFVRDEYFENARPVLIRLNHRVGKFIKLNLYFESRWIMISEVQFTSQIAHGNFTPESAPLTTLPPTSNPGDKSENDINEDFDKLSIELNGNTETEDIQKEKEEKEYDDSYIGVIIGALAALILILIIVIFIFFYRHKRNKNNNNRRALKPVVDRHVTINLNDLRGSTNGKVSNESQDYAVPDITKSALIVNLPPRPPQSLPNVEPVMMNGPPPNYDALYAAADVVNVQNVSSLQGVSGNNVYAVPNADLLLTIDYSVMEFPRENLRFLEVLGEGQFGEVHLCEAVRINELLNDDYLTNRTLSRSMLVAVKMLRPNADDRARSDFHKEIKIMSQLKDPNIVRVLGVCTREEPLCMIVEYMKYGDLNQFLLEHVAESPVAEATNAKTLSYGCLIYIATQIASGMKYLESLNMVHRDLATRNCLVGHNFCIKISDFGMSRSLYSADYYRIEGRAVLPIRWMAWESILLGKFTTKSDVWSFAVTLWEVLTFAKEQPYESLTDEQVIENAGHYYRNDGLQIVLPRPSNCPKEIFDLMRECWNRQESERPSFREIHMFLQRKNMGYNPKDEKMNQIKVPIC
ncbi:discoidin domain-containing receptor 2 isoform X2 [Patella vulgata]|uniref:discoidin domain-containing receptor 2 isoform X2 n=1 Tax=Patella vulgata TaxID=6465 RepID=UPI0024A7BAF5|nr:discoidin domain-containing receptor 2 isoform X2 [Patella vulgata]